MNGDIPVAPRLHDHVLAEARTHDTTQIHEILIAASAERIWEAITDPDWTARYGYGGRALVEPWVGGRYLVEKPPHLRIASVEGSVSAPSIIIEGIVTAYDPPRRLSMKMRFLVDADSAAEAATEVRYVIERALDGRTRLTVTHELLGAPILAGVVSGGFEHLGAGGGHPYMLRDLKRLLETGRSLREEHEATTSDDNP